MVRMISALVACIFLSGCAPKISYDKDLIIAERGGKLYKTTENTINDSYATVMKRLESSAARCLSGKVVDETVVAYGKTDHMVRFFKRPAGGSIMTYQIKLEGKADSEAANAVVAEISTETKSTTQLTLYYFRIPVLGGYAHIRDIVLEWAKGEHDMCFA